MTHPTFDKNFRLSLDVRPTRYVATLTVDLANRRFSGAERIELSLANPAREIVVHAVDLELTRVLCHTKDRALAPELIERAEPSQTVLLRFPEELPAGAAALQIDWNGAFSAGLRGLYQAGPVAVTQFEAADARRVFPCFDEPDFKAPWSLSVRVPSDVMVLSNGAPLGSDLEGGLKHVRFAETPPLPTYLVALAGGQLASTPPADVRGVPVRTWAVQDKLQLTGFAQEAACAVLPLLEDYFGLPYGFGKLDQVAVPDFEAGAMENAGLVTFREVALLLDPKTASLPILKRVSEIITHELAHHWFGNWVTMRWWDDLWLNEAFATWMGYKIVDRWKPQWRVWLDFDAGKAAALHLDALHSTHPIRSEVRNADEATESFDLITYEKGGAVLRMIEGFLGEEGFREGVRLYMRRHGKANAVADDLWSALAEASHQPVVEFANVWIRQPGYPVVSVRRDGARLLLSQRRFFSEPGARDGSLWPIGMVLRYQDERGVREQRVMLDDPDAVVELDARGDIEWLCANASATGFYRVSYDEEGLLALAKNLPALEPAERIALLSDEWALVRAGEREVAPFLDLCAGFKGEQDYGVLDALTGRMAALEHWLVADADRPRLRALLEELFARDLDALGWDAAKDEGDEVRQRRAALVRLLGGIGRSPGVVEEAARRLERFWGGDAGALEPNLHDSAVGMAARVGDASRFDELLRRFQAETEPAFKRRYLHALAAFEDEALASRAEQMAFDPQAIPLQDLASFLGVLLANRTAREPVWGRMRESWEALIGRAAGAPMLMRRVIEGVGQLPERRHFDEAKAFLDAHPLEAAKQATAQTLERMRLDVALRERAMPHVGAWLRQRAADIGAVPADASPSP